VTASLDLKETFLQFGTGNFFRAFVDLFVAEENRAGGAAGRIVAVQSTGAERARELNERDCRYHVAIRGFREGKVIDEVEEVDSISRVLMAASDWDEILKVASSPDLKWIISNVTEAGLTLEEQDLSTDTPPSSFPAKLLQCLLARYKAGVGGITILPCELVSENGNVLKKLVLQQAARWASESAFVSWLETECRWVNSLVDRIVPGKPVTHPLLATDPLLISAETFAFWALEGSLGNLPLTAHPAVVTAPDISGYALRKVRILNGAHTALVAKAMPLGITTVREAVEHPEVGPWIRRLLFEEIVPVLEGVVEHPELFARQTLDRFANPFLDHNLSDIAKGHEGKVALRLLPTRQEYRERFGREPELLVSIL
jgi:tagaturonate reductase